MDHGLQSSLLELEKNPGDAGAWVAMARALRDTGRTEDALTAARKAIELGPGRAAGWRLSAELGAQLGMATQPVVWLEEAARLESDVAENWVLLGQARMASGDLSGAEEALQQGLEVDPHHLVGIATLARVRIRRRRPDEAERILAPHLSRSDPHVAMAWSLACRDAPARALPGLREAMAHARGFTQVRLLHELGTVYDALGDADRAFAAFQNANDARRTPFDPDAYDAMVDAMIARWPARACEPATGEPCPVLWIVGLPRSGTSLLEQMLGAHSSVWPGGELHLLANAATRLNDGADEGSLARAVREAYATRAEGRRWITDKMPDNLLRLGVASRLAPGSAVIAMRRDPLDGLWSCYRQCFGDRLAWTTRLPWLARAHRAQTRALDHYRSVVQLPWIDVDYADLVSRPRDTLEQVLGAAGLAVEPACLAPHRQDRVVATASVDELRRPIHRRSVGRATAYRDHLAPLIEALSPR